jgi:hypothetical protein
MKVTGLEFHRTFWDIITVLEGIRHQTMRVNTSMVDFVEATKLKHQGFNIRLEGSQACVMVNSFGLTETQQQRAELGWRKFSESDNLYLTPRFKTFTPPVDLAVPAKKAHLAADIIHYWFALNSDIASDAVATRAVIGRKYALDVHRQMQTWLNTLDEFHRYILLQS